MAATIDTQGEPRLVGIDNYPIDIPPAAWMLLVRNDDIPGMIGLVGTILGEGGINIDDMRVGRDKKGDPSMMVIATGSPVTPGVAEALRNVEGILEVNSFA